MKHNYQITFLALEMNAEGQQGLKYTNLDRVIIPLFASLSELIVMFPLLEQYSHYSL